MLSPHLAFPLPSVLPSELRGGKSSFFSCWGTHLYPVPPSSTLGFPVLRLFLSRKAGKKRCWKSLGDSNGKLMVCYSKITVRNVLWICSFITSRYTTKITLNLMNTKAYKYCAFRTGWQKPFCKCVKNFKLVWEDEEKSGGGAEIYFEGWTIQMKAEHTAFSRAILRGDTDFRRWRYHINIYCWGYTEQD